MARLHVNSSVPAGNSSGDKSDLHPTLHSVVQHGGVVTRRSVMKCNKISEGQQRDDDDAADVGQSDRGSSATAEVATD